MIVGIRIDAEGNNVALMLTDETTNNGFRLNYNAPSDVLSFDTTNGTGAKVSERMRIDSSGNVGIGTAAPSALMHLKQTTGNAILRINSDSGERRIDFGDATDDDGGRIKYDGTDNLQFYTSGSEHMRLDSGGKLNVNNITGSARVNISADNWPENALALYSAGIAGQTNFAGMGFFNQDADSPIAQVADIYTNPTGTLSLTASGNPAIQLKYGSFGISGGTPALTVDNAGRIGIGTITPNTSSKFHVSGGRSYFASNSDAFATYLRYNDSTAGVFVGSPAANEFQVSLSSGAATFKIDSSGNVGIGDTVPLDKVHIREAVNSATATQLLLQNEGGGNHAAGIAFQVSTSGETTGFAPKAGIVFERGLANGRGDLKFFNDSTNDANGFGAADEKMRIDSNGNVGIGASETSLFNAVGSTAKLVVTGSTTNTNIAGNSDASIVISNTSTTAGNTSGLHFARADTDDTPNYAGASIVAQFPDTQVTGQYPRGELAFLTSTSPNAAPSEKMRITTDGNARFIDGSVSQPSMSFLGDINTGIYRPTADHIGIVTGGTQRVTINSSGIQSPYQIEAGLGTGSVAMTVNDGYGNANLCFNHKNGVPDTNGSSYRIETAVDAAAAYMHFELASSTTTGTAITLPTILRLDPQGADVTGAITATGNITAFSDERLKSDITTIDNALDKVTAMRGVTFTKDGEVGSGVIAQELEKIAPELVRTEEYKSVAYGNLVGYLIEAVKELSEKVEALENGSTD